MKILHTSDWHLGHRLHEQSQFEEQSRFLSWLKDYIYTTDIDVLLVSGDIYDTGAPSFQSQKLYYDFLISLQNSKCKHILITGGNHDAPGIINAPKALLESMAIRVVGKAIEEVSEEVFSIDLGDEHLLVAAVPYLRDQDIRRAVAGESFDEIGDRYKTALIRHYDAVATICKNRKKENTIVVAMGHLFAHGGSTSDSEQTIYIGNLGDIGAEDFDEVFDYVALGHLHRPQKVGKKEHIRYSGSPNILSFSELAYKKQILVLETEESEIKKIEEVEIPVFRKVVKIQGSIEQCVEDLERLSAEEHELTPWVEVILENLEAGKLNGAFLINKAAEKLNLEVLKVSLKKEVLTTGLEQLIENSKNVKELSPIEVFKLKCKEADFDIDANQTIFDAFCEVLEIARNK